MAAMPLPIVSAESNTNARSISGCQFISAFAEIAFAGHCPREGGVGNRNQSETNKDPPQPRIHETPDNRGDEIYETHWQHEFPGEVHQLIHAKTRERAANPNEETNQREQLNEEPRVTRNEIEEFKGRAPTAEEQCDGHAADRE